MKYIIYFTIITLSLNSLTSCDKKEYGHETVMNITLEHEDGFVGDKNCMECHKDYYDTWKGSHHDLAMQIASNSTVLGNFNNYSISLDGVNYKFTKKGEEFWVYIKEIDGSEKDYKVSYTFGVTPLQQYLIDFDGGKKQVLRISWDSVNNKWFHQYSGEKIATDDWMHWSKNSQNWNTMCAECHSTNLKKNYSIDNDTYHTTYSSINVSCESCHGAGERHVYWAKNFSKEDTERKKTFITRGATQIEQMNMCAACHSRRTNLTNPFTPNLKYDEQFILQNLSAEFYHPDGQIKEEDYVYGSFLQSKMYHNDVKCSDCHNPHSLKLIKQGNDLCLQCHTTSYNTPTHHFHKPNTEESLCVNCHMTGKTYMGNDFRRDHSFRVPRPDQSVVYNTPNACTECHKDKSNKWAANQIVKWYGTVRPVHFSDALLLSNKIELSPDERKIVSEFINNSTYPAIARSTAIFNFPIIGVDDFQVIVKSLDDTSPIVRLNTLNKIQNSPPNERISIASRFLGDSIKMVRVAAAQLISDIPDDLLNTVNKEQLNKARNEYLEMLFTNADFSLGRVQLAQYYSQNNQVERAITNYNKALEMDKLLFPAYPNLAVSYSQAGNTSAALSTLNTWMQLQPESGYAYFLRALLNFELNNNTAAISDLKTALRYEPENTRVMYNLATYYFQNQQFTESKKYIKMALNIEPNNPDYQNLLRLLQGN